MAVRVVVGITDTDRLVAALRRLSGSALARSSWAACPRWDHRLLVVDGRVLQVVRRRAAHVVGDRMLTVRQLLNRLNSDPLRGTGVQLAQVVHLDDGCAIFWPSRTGAGCGPGRWADSLVGANPEHQRGRHCGGT